MRSVHTHPHWLRQDAHKTGTLSLRRARLARSGFIVEERAVDCCVLLRMHRAARRSACTQGTRCDPMRDCHHQHAPPSVQIFVRQMSELSVRLRGWGPFPISAALTAGCVPVGFAPLALRLPPDKTSRACPCRRLVVILALMTSQGRYSHRGLAPHKFALMLGAHPPIERTCSDCAYIRRSCGTLGIANQEISNATWPRNVRNCREGAWSALCLRKQS